MSDSPTMLDGDSPAARLRAKQRARRRQLIGLGVRLLLITGLSLWLLHRLGLSLSLDPPPPRHAPPSDTVTFSEPRDLPRAPGD